MKNPANDRTVSAMAPMMLKTLPTPMPAIQGFNAKTKIVDSVYRQKLTAVKASPTISKHDQFSVSPARFAGLTVIRIEDVCQGQGLQRCTAKVAHAVGNGHLNP